MPFNGSGVFTRVYNWVNDKNSSINITASRMDGEFNGMATGLSQCVTKDGQTTITADLPMAGFKHTNVADAAAANQYATYKQQQNNTAEWLGTAGGTVDALTASPTIALAAYVTGQNFQFSSIGTNTSTTPTLNISGLGAKVITYRTGPLAAGDIPASGIVCVSYNGTTFDMLNAPLTGISALTGDVVATGPGSVSATIQSDAVTTSKILNGNVTYAKIASAAIATASEIRSSTASKLVDAAQLLTALTPYSTTTTLSSTNTPFTSIPAGVRCIVLGVSGASSNGTGAWTVEIGDSGGYETSGYAGTVQTNGASASFSSSFQIVTSVSAGDTYDGVIRLTRGDSSTNTWHIQSTIAGPTGPLVYVSTGSKSLSAELDRVKVVAGGNSWDAGKITCEAFYF